MSSYTKKHYDQIVRDISTVERPSICTVDCWIIANGVRMIPHKVINIDELRDFRQSPSDEIVLEVYMPRGDYQRHILPYPGDVEIELKFSWMTEREDVKVNNLKPIHRTFKAYLMSFEDADRQDEPKTDEDRTLTSASFSLIDKTTDLLRMEEISGTFVKQPLIDILRVIYGNRSMALDIPSEERCKGVEFAPPSRVEPPHVTMIRPGLPLLDLPMYLQKKCGGIYNQGIGTYYHQKIWYIYPLYDSSRYDVADYVMDIFDVQPNLMPGLDRTYRIKDEKLQIVTTGATVQTDRRDIDYVNYGNGIRFGLAKKLFNEYAGVTDNRATVNPERTMAQFTLRERDVDNQMVKYAENRITDNVAHEMSKMYPRTGQYVLVTWENSRPDFIIPGMPVKYIYQAESEIKEIKGTVLKAENHRTQESPGMTTRRMRTTTALTIFLDDDTVKIV